MKILVTGATGFVGRWLVRELGAAGHEAVGTPSSSILDIADHGAVRAFVDEIRPDATVHLAAISYGPDAREDPDRAMTVNAEGTQAVMEAVGRLRAPSPVLVISSSEVYGHPDPSDLPLGESAPLRTDQPYGLSKLGQERAAFAAAEALAIPVVIARAFNHTGPGQRRDFVVPALAARIVDARAGGGRVIRVGNVDVRRDFSDVRDVVRAYRLLIEAMAASQLPSDHRVFNVASGQAVAIRDLIDRLAAMAGIEIELEVDPVLVRTSDAPEIRGDASRLAADIGWQPTIGLETTLADVLSDVAAPRDRTKPD